MDPKVNSLFDIAVPNGNVPQLPTWVIEPDSETAAQECERDLTLYFTKQYMVELGVSYEDAVEMVEPHRVRLVAEGARRAIAKLASVEELTGRALTLLAFRSYRASLHAYDPSEPQSFGEFLLERLGHVKSPGTVSETMFFLEMLDLYDRHGQGEFVEGIFRDRKGFAKLSKQVSELRRSRNIVVAAERSFEEANTRMEKSLRNAKSEEEREEIETHIQTAKELQEKTMTQLWGNLTAKLEAAVRMSKDPNIDVEHAAMILSTVTAENPEGTAIKPDKLPVEKIPMEGGFAYIICVGSAGERMVERAISDFAEVVVTSAEAALEKFKPYL